MGARTSRILALTALFTTTMIMGVSGAGSATAADYGTPQPEPVQAAGSVVASGQVISVKVSGSGYKGGSSGSGGGGTFSVGVPAPCWMTPGMTGKAYAEYVDSGQFAREARQQGENVTPRPGYEAFKAEDKSRWWGFECSSANWPDPNDTDGSFAFAGQFQAAHLLEFVPATDPPPVAPVPPELLREIAIKHLTLPDPKLDWNPKLKTNQGTLVNLDTWFWLDHSPTTLTVTAAGGNQATVTVTYEGMVIKADGEAPVPCDGTGTPYTRGAHTVCALVFSQASRHLGSQATHVTVNTRWAGTWTANGVGRGPISPQPDPVSASVDIQVNEVQTLVTTAQ